MEAMEIESQKNALKVELFQAISQMDSLLLLEEMKQFIYKRVEHQNPSNLFITPDTPILNFSEYIREREASKQMSKQEFLEEIEKW
jgi:hypothetical protein